MKRIIISFIFAIMSASAFSLSVDRENLNKDLEELLEKSKKGELNFVKLLNDAKKGNVAAQTKLAILYLGGNGIAENLTEAAKWFTKAADQENSYAQNKLGDLYYLGKGVPQDLNKAINLYRKAAKNGNPTAQENLGVMYLKGHGISKDYKEAAKYLKQAAEQNEIKDVHLLVLGALYREGIGGISKDASQAANWFLRAAEQGNIDAQNLIGYMYATGEGITQNNKEAVKWFRKAIEKGHKDALFNLTSICFPALIVTNTQEKLSEITKLYNLDFPSKLENLSDLGIDLEETMIWFHLAAEQDDADAQSALGLIYLIGYAVPKNEKEALKWFRKSAAQGNEKGQQLLEYSLQTFAKEK